MRADLAEHVRASYDATVDDGPRLSHLLLTKLDEVPGEEGVSELAARLALPVRWVTDGQDIPGHLAPGVSRLVEALGAYGGLPSPAAAALTTASAAWDAAPSSPATRIATSRPLDRPFDADAVGAAPRRDDAVAPVPRAPSAR
jgi:hypothetical protein